MLAPRSARNSGNRAFFNSRLQANTCSPILHRCSSASMPPTGSSSSSRSGAVAVRRFLDFAGDAVLVAHNARFDLSFLDRETERLTGARLGAPVVDTVGLARRLLAGRTSRAGLASLAQFVGTAARPCHRALPHARAPAEILIFLLGLAQER